MVSLNLLTGVVDRIRPSARALRKLPLAAVLAVACTGQAWAGLLVSDLVTNAVKEYDRTTGAFIGDFVPAGAGGLQGPVGLVVTQDARLLVSSADGSVKQYNATTGTPLGDFVAPGAGGLVSPQYLTFGPDGNLYVSDLGTNTVKRFSGTTGEFLNDFVVPQFNPGVDPRNTGLSQPVGLAFGPDANLYISSSGPDLNVECTTPCTSPAVKSVVGTPLNPSLPTTFIRDVTTDVVAPFGLIFDANGNFFVSDFGTDQVKKFDLAGNLLLTLAAPALTGPDGLAFGPDGNLYVSSSNNSSVVRFDPTGGVFAGVFVAPGDGGLLVPTGLLFNPFQADLLAVPEPSSVPLVAFGLVALLAAGRKRQRSTES